MASPTPRSQTSASEVALGLVIERPATSTRVAQRLNERLGSTQFAVQTVSRALKRLEDQEFVCLVGGEYVATSRGIEHFRDWLSASLPLPPVREELLAKVALCRAEDLPRLIGVVRDSELACVVMVGDLNRRVCEERRVVDGVTEWRRRARVVVMGGDLAWWEARMVWLQNLRGGLEEEWQRFQTESQAASSQRV
jgi:DNA-binding PadR family transcriptional regulator